MSNEAKLPFNVSILARDMERLHAFYRALLGLPDYPEKRSPIFRALKNGDTLLGFHAPAAYQLLDIADRMPSGAVATVVYATFLVASDEEVNLGALRAVQLGGRILKPPYRTYYHAWQAVLADPEGNMFRLSAGSP